MGINSKYVISFKIFPCSHSEGQFKHAHLPSKTNVFADLISRGNFQKFKKLAPLADIFPTSVPETFWKLLETLSDFDVQEFKISTTD
jgi:hypothetical protein